MRKEKFLLDEDGDDIRSAFNFNGLGERLKDIDVIVAEVCGANDEYSWYWVLKMKDGLFAWAEGSCDYTGWDCQSGAQIHSGFKTAKKAIEGIVLSKYEPRKKIKECLSAQINGKIAFAIYQEDI